MLIQLLSFRCKRNSSIRSDKQFTPKLILQIIHKMSNIRLVAHQYFRRFRKALIHCYIIKNPVMFKICIHRFISFSQAARMQQHSQQLHLMNLLHVPSESLLYSHMHQSFPDINHRLLFQG